MHHVHCKSALFIAVVSQTELHANLCTQTDCGPNITVEHTGGCDKQSLV